MARRHGRRRLWLAGLAVPLAGAAAWFAVHRYPALGPLVAESLRSVLGARAVAKLEDWAYGAEDGVQRLARSDETPTSYWDVPSAPSAASGAGPTHDASFVPADVGPVHKSWSAPGDGQWLAMTDPRHPADAPRLYKTLLHPDRNRSWAEVFVVAIDLKHTTLHLVAGSHEPKALLPGTQKLARPARVPDSDQPELLAAFNGGWRTEHGYYGMKLDGLTLIKPRPTACTIAVFSNGETAVRSYSTLAPRESEMVWYRQAPACLFESGERDPRLAEEKTALWGATVDGDTVIRRSGIGIDEKGETLYVAITNHTTARALADGLRHAGALHVAQLDVNWSYPKFVTFTQAAGGALEPVALAKGFELEEDEYLRKRSVRDFFYLTRAPEKSAQN